MRNRVSQQQITRKYCTSLESGCQLVHRHSVVLTTRSLVIVTSSLLQTSPPCTTSLFICGTHPHTLHSHTPHSLTGLSRDHLVLLAYLLGSDYVEGLEGVGVVSAMEMLQDSLERDWNHSPNFYRWAELTDTSSNSDVCY